MQPISVNEWPILLQGSVLNPFLIQGFAKSLIVHRDILIIN